MENQLLFNPFASSGNITGLPQTTHPINNPFEYLEQESNDTFYDAFFTSSSGISSDPFDSFLLLSNFSTSSDTDIFALAPEYQVSAYFKTQGPASCSIYWQNQYGLDMPSTNVPDSYFHYVNTLSSSPINLEILSHGGEYIFICSGSASGSYSIQTDPGPNAKNQYISFHHLGSSSGNGTNFFEILGLSSCNEAHTTCISNCNKLFAL
ncbi:hypothetical protein [Leptospira wolffii]|uniref:hypothetical protein n=1 Tax=Leptospira wolffii TaxID=409998 RepID=UPI000F64F040|nr:hypothetical protein [Leptospira wolffii]